MATFQSDIKAEERARTKGPAGDNTWVEAHQTKADNGTPAVRALRKVTPTGGGEWFTTTDDATV